MSETAVFAVFTVPFLVFVLAGNLEFQRDRKSLRSFTRMLPLVCAAFLSSLLIIDLHYPYLSLHFGIRFSQTLSALSLLVGVSALVCKYKSRAAKALIFSGGFILAFFWLLGQIRP